MFDRVCYPSLRNGLVQKLKSVLPASFGRHSISLSPQAIIQPNLPKVVIKFFVSIGRWVCRGGYQVDALIDLPLLIWVQVFVHIALDDHHKHKKWEFQVKIYLIRILQSNLMSTSSEIITKKLRIAAFLYLHWPLSQKINRDVYVLRRFWFCHEPLTQVPLPLSHHLYVGGPTFVT